MWQGMFEYSLLVAVESPYLRCLYHLLNNTDKIFSFFYRGEPSVSYAQIYYNTAGRRTESAGTVLIENGRGGAVYADKINDQQSILCKTYAVRNKDLKSQYIRPYFKTGVHYW